jgi:hypothetical protein
MDYSKIFELSTYSVAGLLGFGYGLKKFLKFNNNKVDNFNEIHTEIHELLTEIRLTGIAMRATILQFHNGEYFMDGISMRKFSITHESSHRGYISQVNKFKNVLCSLFIPLLNKVVDNKPLIFSVEAMSESYAKHFFEDENVSHYACLPLKNKGINVGFILLQWHKDFKPEVAEHIIMDYFESIRNSIELQLSHQKN